MKAEELFYSMEHVGEDLLAATEQTVRVRQPHPWRNAALAAGAVLVVGLAGFVLWRQLGGNPEPAGPQSTVTMPGLVNSTEATEPRETVIPREPETLRRYAVGNACLAQSTLLLQDPRAWLGAAPEDLMQGVDTLPIYENPCRPEAEGSDFTRSRDLLEQMLRQAAQNLNTELTGEIQFRGVGQEEGSYREAGAQVNLGELTVTAGGQVTLVYDNRHRYTAPLPADAGEAALGEAFLEHLKGILGAARWQPMPGGQHAVLSDGWEYLEAYPLTEDSRDQVSAYALERIRLLHQGNILRGVILPGPLLPQSHLLPTLCAQADCGMELPPDAIITHTGEAFGPCLTELAYYPVITPETARELAASGQYFTDGRESPYPLDDGYPAMDWLDSWDLAYLENPDTGILLPFYRFLVPMGTDEAGYTGCGFNYVPAIDGAFLEDYPLQVPREPVTRFEGFTRVEEEGRSYCTDGQTELWLEGDTVMKKELSTGETQALFTLTPEENTVTLLVGATAGRLYIGWNNAEAYQHIGGLDVYSVDYQGRDRQELAQLRDVVCQDGWILLQESRTDVGMSALRIIDQNDQTLVNLNRSWGGAVVEGRCWYIYAPRLEDWEALEALSPEERDKLFQNMPYDVCRLDRDGQITVTGTLVRNYYAAEFQIDPETRTIRQGFGSPLSNLDLYTLEPVPLTDRQLQEIRDFLADQNSGDTSLGPIEIRDIQPQGDGTVRVSYDATQTAAYGRSDQKEPIWTVTLYYSYEGGWEILSNLPGDLRSHPISELALGPVDPTQDVGADIQVIYQSRDRLIFYGYFGLFVYRLPGGELLQAIDLKQAFDISEVQIQGSGGVSAQASRDGSQILLTLRDSQENPGEVLDNLLMDLNKGSYQRALSLSLPDPQPLQDYESEPRWGSETSQLRGLYLELEGERWYPFGEKE